MKKLFLLVLAGIIYVVSFGQGTVRGKITDENGETIIGAVIMKKSNMSFGTITDLDGNFSLKITDSTAQTLIISSVGKKKIEETVHPVNGEVVIVNFNLTPSVNQIQEVVIASKAVKAKDYYMEKLKMNSSTTLDYVSSETMKKTGDANAVAAVARVSGVSTNSSGFITIRGIGDRYVKTAINGSRIPTLDPFTNNIKLDIFPASLIDNIIITKTASPDLPGDWAGAYISVETKDYPDQLSINVESTFGYNNQTTFRDVISSQRSSTDWLGYDNGFRNHSHNDFASPAIIPTQYQEFVALGLGNYYNSMGVTSWQAGTTTGDTYYKLGLIQLGFLAPAQINDPVAFANAKTQFNNSALPGQAFNTLNAGAAKTGQSFPDNWNTTRRNAPLDFSQSFSIGNQIRLFGRPLGFLAGFRYGNATLYDPNSLAQRPYPVTGLIQSSRDQEVSKLINGWSALFNLAYKLNSNNSISLLFMPNFNGVNNARDAYDAFNGTRTISQFYEERKQLVYQVKSENYIPQCKLKIESNASYTQGRSSAPDFKVLGIGGIGVMTLDPTNDPADRYYRYLTDNLFDSRISAELPIGNKPDLPRKLKFGGSYQNDQQKSDQYNYHLHGGNASQVPSSSIDQLLSLDNFGISNNSMVWYYQNLDVPLNHTFGNSSTLAGFAMVDYAIIPSLRVSGGLRVEHVNIFTDVDLFDSLSYARGDIRRYPVNSIDTSISNPGKLNETSLLPSVNVIYKLKKSEENPVNLRFNFSQTVARPSIRELSAVSVFDYELQAPVKGNPDLKMVEIKNYDMRLESIFKNGDNLSASLFYKDFKNHIELEYGNTYTWTNADKSYAAGIELEGKKKLMRQLEFKSNITFVNSKTSIGAGARPMFGQAPYIINAMLVYSADSIGLTAALSYNIQGPRLVLISNIDVPDIYELPRHLMDFKVTKKLSKHFSASFTVRNIFNAPIRRSYKYPTGYNLDYDKYRYGTNFLLGIAYKI